MATIGEQGYHVGTMDTMYAVAERTKGVLETVKNVIARQALKRYGHSVRTPDYACLWSTSEEKINCDVISLRHRVPACLERYVVYVRIAAAWIAYVVQHWRDGRGVGGGSCRYVVCCTSPLLALSDDACQGSSLAHEREPIYHRSYNLH